MQRSSRYFFCFLLFFSFIAVQVSAQENPFSWTMALQNVRSGEMLSFSAPVQASTGEQFRLLISSSERAFCYVIAESSNGGDLAVLFAGPIREGETWLSPIMQLAPPRGSESLFIIKSREEQRTLAQRISAFNSNSGNTQRRALINEIFRIRSDASRFREAPEKPVLMGGASRGSTPESNQGVEYSGLEIYVKTISIEH